LHGNGGAERIEPLTSSLRIMTPGARRSGSPLLANQEPDIDYPDVLGSLTAVKNSDSTGTGSGGQVTWTYSVANSAVAYLAAGHTKVESFNLSLTDQRGGLISRQVDVTINGVNDTATIAGTPTGSVTEDGTLTAGNTLSVNDVDTGENHFQTPASLAGTHGAFDIDAATGAWGYTLNNGAGNVQALGANAVVHDTLI
jgi:VCBS repeat-containing protein